MLVGMEDTHMPTAKRTTPPPTPTPEAWVKATFQLPPSLLQRLRHFAIDAQLPQQTIVAQALADHLGRHGRQGAVTPKAGR
jgi:hypothetical protein